MNPMLNRVCRFCPLMDKIDKFFLAAHRNRVHTQMGRSLWSERAFKNATDSNHQTIKRTSEPFNWCFKSIPATNIVLLCARNIVTNTQIQPDPFVSSTDAVNRAARPATIHQQPNHSHVLESCERLHNSVMTLNNRVSVFVLLVLSPSLCFWVFRMN